MKIIIDTREQLPLSFTGHETIRRKLDEGDYNIKELKDKICIERKSVGDLYNSITNDHARFKKELLRCKDKKKQIYIFIEGTLQDLYFYEWSNRTPKRILPSTVEKIILTMKQRYNITFVECEDRDAMSKKIVELIDGEMKK